MRVEPLDGEHRGPRGVPCNQLADVYMPIQRLRRASTSRHAFPAAAGEGLEDLLTLRLGENAGERGVLPKLYRLGIPRGQRLEDRAGSFAQLFSPARQPDLGYGALVLYQEPVQFAAALFSTSSGSVTRLPATAWCNHSDLSWSRVSFGFGRSKNS